MDFYTIYSFTIGMVISLKKESESMALSIQQKHLKMLEITLI